MNIRIGIVDDHPLLIMGLKGMLEQHEGIEITDTYQSGKELLAGLKTEQPDVLLLDIQLQGQSGDELMPLLNKQYPNMMVIALTNMEHEYYIKNMLQNGLMGYVLKTSNESVLLAAIEAVHRGSKYFDPAIRKIAAKVQSGITQQVLLTAREKEILQLITEDLTSQEIADRIFINKKTVEAHRLHLLQKLGVKTSASLVKKAIDMGLLK